MARCKERGERASYRIQEKEFLKSAKHLECGRVLTAFRLRSGRSLDNTKAGRAARTPNASRATKKTLFLNAIEQRELVCCS